MKKIIIVTCCILFLLSCVYMAWGRGGSALMVTGGSVPAAPSCADSSCTGFLICQNFEGTGYDNSESWSEGPGSGGAVNEDYTTTALRGSQSLNITAGTGESYDAFNFTDQTDFWYHVRVRVADSTPGTYYSFIELWTDAYAAIGGVFLKADGVIQASHGGQYTNSSTTFSDNTSYNIWGHYVTGGGSNGVHALYICASASCCTGGVCTRPESPTVNITNGLATGTSGLFVLYAKQSGNIIFDQILLDNAEIGDTCE